MASEKENINESDGLILKMQILDRVPAGVVVTDQKGIIIYMNSFAEKIIGIGLEEAAGKEMLGMLSLNSSDILRAGKFFTELSLGKSVGPEKFQWTRKDGHLLEIELNLYPVEISNKKYFLGVFQDVIENAVSETESKEWASKYGLVVSASGQVPYEYNILSGKVSWGSNIEKVFGYLREEIPTVNEWKNILHPDDRERAVRTLEEASRKSEFLEDEYRLRKKNGDYIWVMDRGFFLRNNEGKVFLQIGMIENITIQKETREKLRHSEELYRTLAESITDRIYIVGVDRCVKFANEFAMKSHNAKNIENICISIEMLFPNDSAEFLKTGIAKAFEKGASEKREILEKTGENEKWTEATISPVKDDSGKVSSVLIICHDITKRKMYENAINERERLYRTLTESLEDRIYLVGKDMCVKFANSTAAGFHNARNVENICIGVEMLFPRESIDFIRNGIRDAFESRKTVSGEIEEKKKDCDGWLDVTITPVKEDVGDVSSVMILCHDITQRKQMEADLTKTHEMYKLISEKTGDMISILSFETAPRYIFVSPSVEKTFGYKPEELLGKNPMDFLHHDDVKNLSGLLFRYMEQKGKKILGIKDSQMHEDFEYRFRRKDGEWRNAECSADLVGDKIITISRDVTEKRKSEREIRESEEKYRLLFQNANEAVYLHEISENGPGKFIDVNEKACDMLGYSREEFLKMKVEEIDVPEQKDKIPEILKKIYEKGSYRFETEHLSKNGKRIPVEISIRIFEMKGKNMILSMVHDITYRKESEVKIRRAKEILSGIVHGTAVPLFVLNEKNEVIYWNVACEELTGIKSEVIIGTKNQYKAFYDSERPVLADMVIKKSGDEELKKYYTKVNKSEVIEGALISEGFFSRLGKNGKWLLFTAAPLRDEQGNISGAIETFQDITEIKESEAELKKMDMIIRNSSELINLADMQGKMVFLNEAGRKMLGITDEKVEKYTISDVIPTNLKEKVSKEILPAILEKGKWIGEVQYINITTHEIRNYYASTFLINDEKGNPLYYANVSIDITDIKKMEDEMRFLNNDLKIKIEELEKFQKLSVGRELKMVDLKRRIDELEKELAK